MWPLKAIHKEIVSPVLAIAKNGALAQMWRETSTYITNTALSTRSDLVVRDHDGEASNRLKMELSKITVKELFG